jgi:hypothetical protein
MANLSDIASAATVTNLPFGNAQRFFRLFTF